MKTDKVKKWLNENYGPFHMKTNIELKDTESIFALMEEYAQRQPSCLGAVMHWVAASERLPEITHDTMSDWLLTFDPMACRIDKAFYSKVTGWQAEHGEEMSVSHWMELPEPPCT